MIDLDIQTGASLRIQHPESKAVETVLVLSAGPITVRYRDGSGTIRSLLRRDFLKRSCAAIGVSTPPPLNTLSFSAQPMGGQPGFRRRRPRK